MMEPSTPKKVQYSKLPVLKVSRFWMLETEKGTSVMRTQLSAFSGGKESLVKKFGREQMAW